MQTHIKQKNFTLNNLGEMIIGFERKMDDRFDSMEGDMKEGFDRIDKRFIDLEDRMLARFDGLEGRMYTMEEKISTIEHDLKDVRKEVRSIKVKGTIIN